MRICIEGIFIGKYPQRGSDSFSARALSRETYVFLGRREMADEKSDEISGKKHHVKLCVGAAAVAVMSVGFVFLPQAYFIKVRRW